MNNSVEIYGLTKKFGDLTAVNNIDLTIKKGEIFGLLGPNGAGKTTTISMLLGIVKPTSGRIIIEGYNAQKESAKVKQVVGFMAQETIVDSDLTAYQNLEIAARLYHMPRNEWAERISGALKSAQLEQFADKKAGTFSGGMKRRLYLVKSMLHAPQLIILDEPTTGLDVQNRIEMWRQIRELNKSGVTVIITTQYLEEADNLCNRIAIIDHGQLKAIGTPSELKRSVSEGQILEIISTASEVEGISKLLKSKFGINSEFKDDKVTGLIEKDPIGMLPKILNELKKEKLYVAAVNMHLPTMDDVFIKLTGSTIRDKAGEFQSDRNMLLTMR
ncbi:MAG: ATP-binding cassette domain-containing protein [Candidatus Micrarchaeales archaeon]|uniref:Daunorubicin resistance ABC transporter ATPase subunit n=1 Tax=Candidatus Micrarchaeum acidiphilum ARMAN-2 TaxID=425595 RepID=C7DH26_MICA2|nr:MAG: daunorubicin resistance ABC transporter ATPase subunit [Candidatus Micrarchaeum acidiphilum ARMAN-2]MCW6161415.1 ATP-binding cassette domain-containing protein [Candidatus Micrarchaeales archaeon]